MKNLDKHEWEFSYGERFAVNWFDEHGFDVVLEKRHVTVDYFSVTKNGVTDKFRLPLGDPKINYQKVMQQFEKNFDMLCELEEMRKEFKEVQA